MQGAGRIAAGAFQALRDALPVVFWYKRPFEAFLRAALREHPELLAGLDFAAPKREVTDALVDRLVAGGDRYRATTVALIEDLAARERFSDMEDLDDAPVRIDEARRAVAEVRRWRALLADQERARSAASAGRALAEGLADLRERFLALQAGTDAAARGGAFETFLHDLFALFDLDPRLSYRLEREELDGALTFDTDDYVVEAKWRRKPTDRATLDVFAAKVRRKGKNALGIFVSVNGFTAPAIEEYRHSTPFLTVDGADLMAVLDQRLRLDDLLRRKKRHANETGSCWLPAAAVLVG